MAEASVAKKKVKKKGKTGEGKLAPPPPPADPPLGWRTWATIGVVLVGGVVFWKLVGASYKHDVETICNAERGSGFTVQKELSKVTQWVRDHLATPEGNQFYSALADTRVTERAKKLEDEAGKLGIAPCPLVPAYQHLAAEADARADVQQLCSTMAFPKLLASEDPVRLTMMSDWIDKNARSPRTKELLEALKAAPAGPERGKVLREAAGKLDAYSCENAKTLEKPPPVQPTGAPIVKLFADLQIVGGMREEDVTSAFGQINGGLVDCYKKGIERKPDLGGRLVVKLEIDPDGKVVKDGPGEGNALPDQDTMMCMVKLVRTMKFPKNPGPLVSVLAPLELTHADK